MDGITTLNFTHKPKPGNPQIIQTGANGHLVLLATLIARNFLKAETVG